mmetsp:Transcript_3732/g.6911  ORF Transcript_3732/g.6911 Transcript_3732/m.6911 type:complete len:236 (-) Transcript_3732:32-739(-)
MPKSLAPSPTASTSSGWIPRLLVIRVRASTFASRPTIGRATSPVRTPFSASRTLAWCSSKPSFCAIAWVNAVKPPDTSAQRAPCAFIVASSVAPPGMRVMRFSSTAAIVLSGRPFRSPTRSSNAASKFSSPFMARAVIAATRSPKPASAANSSMHSCWIMVLSMSASNTFRFRSPAVCQTISTPSALRLSHTVWMLRGIFGTSNSAQWFGSSQIASPPPMALRRFVTRLASRYMA